MSFPQPAVTVWTGDTLCSPCHCVSYTWSSRLLRLSFAGFNQRIWLINVWSDSAHCSLLCPSSARHRTPACTGQHKTKRRRQTAMPRVRFEPTSIVFEWSRHMLYIAQELWLALIFLLVIRLNFIMSWRLCLFCEIWNSHGGEDEEDDDDDDDDDHDDLICDVV
jgi:hypothetical protein